MLILKSPAFCLPPFQTANFFSLKSRASLTCHPILNALQSGTLAPSAPASHLPLPTSSRVFSSAPPSSLLPPSQTLSSSRPSSYPSPHSPSSSLNFFCPRLRTRETHALVFNIHAAATRTANHRQRNLPSLSPHHSPSSIELHWQQHHKCILKGREAKPSRDSER